MRHPSWDKWEADRIAQRAKCPRCNDADYDYDESEVCDMCKEIAQDEYAAWMRENARSMSTVGQRERHPE